MLWNVLVALSVCYLCSKVIITIAPKPVRVKVKDKE